MSETVKCALCEGDNPTCQLCDGVGSYPETPAWLQPHVDAVLKWLVPAVDAQILDEVYRKVREEMDRQAS